MIRRLLLENNGSLFTPANSKTKDYPRFFVQLGKAATVFGGGRRFALSIVVRALVAQIGIPSGATVPSLFPLKDTVYSRQSGFVLAPMNQLLPQCSEEALHRRIVQAISLSTHTLCKLVVIQLFLECITRKQRSSVGFSVCSSVILRSASRSTAMLI